jgi:hypothetical protein
MISDWRVDQADLPDTFQHVWGKLTRFVEEAVSPTVMEEVQTRCIPRSWPRLAKIDGLFSR